MLRTFLLFALVGCTAWSSAQDPWPMERGDRWGTNRAPSGPETLTKGWLDTVVGGGFVVSNGPAIASGGIGYYGCWQNLLLVKFDTSTGATLNSFNTLGYVVSNPALAGGQVYAAAGRVYGVDLATFDYNWFYNVGEAHLNDFNHCSPVTGPDLDMMMGAANGKIYRFDNVTGDIVWSRSGLGAVTHTIAFSRDDSAVFVTHGNKLAAFRYSDGEPIWSIDLGSTMGAAGVADNGVIVVGSQAGTIYGVNPTTGGVLWTRILLADSLTSPAFGTNGTVYVTSGDTRLYALRLSDGVRLWSFQSSSSAPSAPSVGHDNMVYFCNAAGMLYKLSHLGVLKWQLQLGGQSRGPMSIGPDGSLYVPTTYTGGGLSIVRQVPAVVFPDSFQYFDGTVFSGSLADLTVSDDAYFTSHSGDIFGSVDVALIGRSPIKVPTKIELDVEAAAYRAGLSFRVSVLKYSTNSYATVGGFVAPTTDLLHTFILTTNASQYVRQSDGQIAVRLTWAPINDEDPAQDGWNSVLDLTRWTITL